MADAMQNLVSEAKRNRYSGISDDLSDEDVTSVWDSVSGFIEKHMTQQKGVNIPGLGLFTFSQQKMDVGNNKYLLMQRPVFLLSEKLSIKHGLKCTKHHTTGVYVLTTRNYFASAVRNNILKDTHDARLLTVSSDTTQLCVGQIPVVQLNFAALSQESPFNRDTVEACVKDVLLAMDRSFGGKRNVEFAFTGIGRLEVRDSKVKMKFYREFLTMVDGTGAVASAMKDRPNTVDSVISNHTPSRPHTSNTLVLPRITQGPTGLAPHNPEPRTDIQNSPPMPAIQEEGVPLLSSPGPPPEAELDMDLDGGHLAETLGLEDTPREQGMGDIPLTPLENEQCYDTGPRKLSPPPGFLTSRGSSRAAVPLAKASGVNFADDVICRSPVGMRGASPLSKSSPAPLMGLGRRSLSPLANSASPRLYAPMSPLVDDISKFTRSKSVDPIPFGKVDKLPSPAPPGDKKGLSPPGSSCNHRNAGQELCYLCHQRDKNNIPVSFAEERRKKEQEEDRLLQQYQHLRDTEAIITEQENLSDKRHDCQKMAAFNLGASEAINHRKNLRPTDFHSSYIFQKRPLTPPRFIKQNQYSRDLAVQVTNKSDSSKKKKADEEFLERLEQVQLAEDLAAQREQFLKDKADQQEQYKRALSAQECEINLHDIAKHLEEITSMVQVQFKPLPMPARVPDSSEPVFGKYDMVNEAMAAKRRRAHNLYQEQLGTVEQRKREAILRRLTEQKDEEEMLARTKKELREDRSDRFSRLFTNRRVLENDWSNATDLKKARENEELLLASSPGMLLHEQCDKYRRCRQCKRQVHNCGESNIWRESRYIPGSRLMV